MRDFTQEEKELIVYTPIKLDCFERGNLENVKIDCVPSQFIKDTFDWWAYVIGVCEYLRQKYNETKDERYFVELIRLLPNSYKVVKL